MFNLAHRVLYFISIRGCDDLVVSRVDGFHFDEGVFISTGAHSDTDLGEFISIEGHSYRHYPIHFDGDPFISTKVFN